MLTRRFALLYGVAFTLVAVLGFVPGINQMHEGTHSDLSVGGPGHGLLLGLFHVNVLHNLVHLLFGLMGLACSRSYGAARGYARFVAVAYALLAVLGLIPFMNIWNTFGLIPINGHDVWLHAVLAAVAAYFGFIRPADRTDGGFPVTTTGTTPPAV